MLFNVFYESFFLFSRFDNCGLSYFNSGNVDADINMNYVNIFYS